MNYLASPNFDAQTMMGSMPIQHYVSEALDNHLKGISKKLLSKVYLVKPLLKKEIYKFQKNEK